LSLDFKTYTTHSISLTMIQNQLLSTTTFRVG